jgi:thioredoxin 1
MNRGALESASTIITDENFEREILKSPVPVLVDFWATWCSSCKSMHPVMDEIAGEYEGLVRVEKVNTEVCLESSIGCGITSIPAIALFVKGKIVDGLVGAVPKFEITQMLDDYLASGSPR